MLSSLTTIDPATLDLIWTTSVSSLLLICGGLTLALLPWRDEEIEAVEHSFRSACSLATAPRRQAPSRG